MRFLEFFAKHRERLLFLIRYGISGAIGGGVQILSLFVWVTLLGLENLYLLGLCLGFALALVTAFMLQKYWVFRDRESRRSSRQLISYTVVAILGLALNAALLSGAKMAFEWLSIDFFDNWYLIAQVGIIAIVSLFNFGMNFLFTFRYAREQQLWNR